MRIGKDDLYILEWYRIDGKLINLSQVKHISWKREEGIIYFDDIAFGTEGPDEFDSYMADLVMMLTGEQWTVEGYDWEYEWED